MTCPAAKAAEADDQALRGDPAAAERLFAEALRGALQTKAPADSNSVCWLGSVDGFAAIVKPACDQAVELAAEYLKAPFRDSRGLARALTGDTTGAIEDFTALTESIKGLKDLSDEDRTALRRREEWIAALKEGRNPFDKEVLKALRIE